MLDMLCKELNNYFVKERVFGGFTISDGTIAVPNLQEGQYFRIVGSVFNDGVYQYPVTDLKDEAFDGAIWLMAVPKVIEDLSEEIDTWIADNGVTLDSPYQSESFGGYSYTLKSGANNQDGSSNSITWQSQFAKKLNPWRKIACHY